jgi:transcriptional regulator with XRE-family HTH domain
MKERIKEFIDYKGISPGDLASLLEVQRSNISHILNGRNKPGASLIEKMLMVFPELNARWLLTGTGSMTEDKITGESEDNRHVKTIIAPIKKELEQNLRSKEISKVVLLYKDGTFDTYQNNT